MKDDNLVHEVEGIDKGECITLMALTADEFILTVVEPEAYGDERQAASMALNRKQMGELVFSIGMVLSDATEGDHND